jgi:hydrogenase expression/formation protein HypC
MCLAIPGRVMEIVDEPNRLAKVDVAGVQRTVNIGLLDAGGMRAEVGDWVLIHVGFAMNRIDAAQAHEQMRILALLGEDLAALEEFNGILDRGSGEAP